MVDEDRTSSENCFDIYALMKCFFVFLLYLQGEGDEFIPKTLALLDDAVNSCLEFQNSEEELQPVLGVAEVMIEMTDHKDALEAEAEEEFVKGALKVLTLAKGLTSASIELCKVS